MMNQVVSFTKNEYVSLVKSLWSFIKSLKSISDYWFDAISWSSLLLEIFMINQCLRFFLIVLGTSKQDCGIKTSEIFSFFPLKNNSVIIGLNLRTPYLLSYHQTLLTLPFSFLD